MLRRLLKSAAPTSEAPAALVENLEVRRLMVASPLTVLGIKVAKRVDVDNTALNSNRITIAFTADGKTPAGIRLLDAGKIRSFGYAEDLLNSAAQRKVTVGLTITQSPSEPGVLTITTDRLIRKGSRLFIELGALTDTKNREIVFDASTPAKTITFSTGQNKARYTMANRNWRPTDLGYFSKDVFTAAPNPTVANVQPNANTVKTNLLAFLNAKVAKGILTAGQVASAMATFENATVIAIVPSANLRAALVSLVGTAAEPAISSYIGKGNVTGKNYTSIDFSNLISGSAPTAETKLSVGGRLSVLVRPALQGEDFRALSSILAHEIIHQDASPAGGDLPSSQEEEIIANAIGMTVYIQQALVDNSFIANGTTLVNRSNEQMLALLNSGDKLSPYGGILQNPGLYSNGNVFVGAKTNPGSYGDSTSVKSFENWIRREYVSRGFSAGGTTSNPVGVAILKNIVGTTGNFTLFGTDVINRLDSGNLILTDVAYVRMAQALKLTY